ncbi:hypothetical protein Tco_0084619 [Tanacetum coccineum]
MISSNQRHCFDCKDVLGDGEFCQRCTCMRCGSGLSKGLCLICASRYGNNPNPNSLNDSPNISENVSQRSPHIDHHCCYGCGDSLDGIFCQRCTCESCGNGAHYGYNCPPKVPTISNPEPCHNQNVDEFPQTLPSFHPTCYSGDGSSFTYDSTPNFVDDSPNLQQRQEQAVNLDTYTPEPSQCQKIPIYYNDDNDEESSIPLRDIIIFELPPCISITPVLLTEELVDSLIMEDKHLDTILATESDEVIKSSVEDLVHTLSESDGISESKCDLPICDDSSLKKDEVLDDIISIPPGNDNDHFNAESSLIESVLNRDNVISSPKIDFLLEEFAGELALIAPIPPGIVESDLDLKEDIRFIENLIDDDSYENIEYVEASPPNLEIVSLEEMNDVDQEEKEFDLEDIL